jgi:acetyltransferase-like isoleucine patch superfamily enzyme
MIGDIRRRIEVERWFSRHAPTCVREPAVQVKGALTNLKLGRDVILQQGCVLHAGGYDWSEGVGRLEIGDGGVLSPYCVIFGAGPGGVRIGRNFDCGPHVGIYASRTGFRTSEGPHVFAPVVIGDDVVVFGHAVISPGVRIGDRAVIAAGAVVVTDVPVGTVVGGVPARPIAP